VIGDLNLMISLFKRLLAQYAWLLCIMAPFYHALMLYWVLHQQWLYALVALYCAYFSTTWGIRGVMSGKNIKYFISNSLMFLIFSITILGLSPLDTSFNSSSFISFKTGWLSIGTYAYATPPLTTTTTTTTTTKSVIDSRNFSKSSSHKSSENTSMILAEIKSPLGPIRIYEDQLQVLWKQNPQQTPQSLLNQLIDFEILALQAQKKGLDRSDELKVHSKSLMVQKYLKNNFEPQWNEKDVPQKYVELAKKQNLHFFKHPPLRKGSHILLMPERGLTDRAPLTLQDHAILSDLIQKVVSDLHVNPPQSQHEFQQKQAHYQTWMPTGYRAHFELLNTFAQEGTYVKAFSDACFQVTQAQSMTDAIETQFGFHVAWIEEVVAAKHSSDKVIEQKIRARIVPEVRQLELQKLLQRLESRFIVQRFTKNIQQAMKQESSHSIELRK
jgi:hypothetical protein